MKISKTFFVILSFCLAATVGFAEEKNNPPSDRPWLGAKADLNNDGKIGVEEAQKAEEVWKQAHRERREERKEDRQEKREDWKEKKEEWKAEHPKMDKDNNPPGPMGGQGTNWENKPGPQGGPGAGPDKGMKMGGGPGGPQGGPQGEPRPGRTDGPQGGPRKQK